MLPPHSLVNQTELWGLSYNLSSQAIIKRFQNLEKKFIIKLILAMVKGRDYYE